MTRDTFHQTRLFQALLNLALNQFPHKKFQNEKNQKILAQLGLY